MSIMPTAGVSAYGRGQCLRQGSEPNGTKISATGGKFYGKAGVGDTVKTLIFIDHPGSQP
jgi:hypothetical protein